MAMSDDEKILKDMYRRAMHICHPDRYSDGASEELRSSMEATAKKLTAAYRARNFLLVRKIAEELGVKDIPPLPKSESAQRWAYGFESEPVTVDSSSSQYFRDNDLIRAAKDGDLEWVQRLISRGANPNAVCSGYKAESGHTALWAAAAWARPEVAEVLLAAGADPNTVSGLDGRTVLMEAVKWLAHWGRAGVVKVLLEAGANPDATDKRGNTALDWVEFKMLSAGSPEVLKAYREDMRLLKEAHREIVFLLKAARAKE